MNAEVIRVERPTTDSRLFAHTRWDTIPALAGLFHLAYFVGLFFLYPHAPLWLMLILGFVYSLMVNANINGVGHNFIHNPFFRSKTLNRIFGVTQSIACCFSQTYVRRRPHAASQGEFRSPGRKRRYDGLVINLSSRARRRGGKSLELRVPEFLSGRRGGDPAKNCASATTPIFSGATSNWPHSRLRSS